MPWEDHTSPVDGGWEPCSPGCRGYLLGDTGIEACHDCGRFVIPSGRADVIADDARMEFVRDLEAENATAQEIARAMVDPERWGSK